VRLSGFPNSFASDVLIDCAVAGAKARTILAGSGTTKVVPRYKANQPCPGKEPSVVERSAVSPRFSRRLCKTHRPGLSGFSSEQKQTDQKLRLQGVTVACCELEWHVTIGAASTWGISIRQPATERRLQNRDGKGSRFSAAASLKAESNGSIPIKPSSIDIAVVQREFVTVKGIACVLLR